MNILDITPRFPFPLTDGALICMYQTILSLSRLGHRLCVVALDQAQTPPVLQAPIAALAELHTVQYTPAPRWLGAIRTLLSHAPYTQKKRDLPQVYRLLDKLQSEHGFQAMIVDEIHVAQYGAYMKKKYGIPYLLRLHNVEHEIYRRHAYTVGNPLMRAYLGLQTRRWERFEAEQWATADVCASITHRDACTVHRHCPDVPSLTLPAAVDLSAFPYAGTHHREPNSMIVLGNMSWEPNRDAAVWFANRILPLILREVPDAVCYLVGSHPPLIQLPASGGNLRIEGRVDSIAGYYNRVTLGLIPLRVGGGMRVKMVEMMASGIPVVSTSQGAEGNMAQPGKHFALADEPEAFAAAVVRLLQNPAERQRLSEAAYEFASSTYSLQKVGEKLDEIVTGISQNTITRS